MCACPPSTHLLSCMSPAKLFAVGSFCHGPVGVLWRSYSAPGPRGDFRFTDLLVCAPPNQFLATPLEYQISESSRGSQKCSQLIFKTHFCCTHIEV